MPTPAESATLLLTLYDLRREETMRKARDFFATFNPKTIEDVMGVMMTPQGAYVRMVVGYWDMAASLVLNGAIDSKMFLDANGEFIVVFAKIEPFLPQLRQILPNPDFLKSLETLTLSIPDARKRIDKVLEFFRNMVAQRNAAAPSA
jgi:hypothetical protein